jgi:O-antigen/teichoic acid export membrane protein
MFLAVEFRFLGTGKYIVREKELTRDKLKSVLGVNFLVSFGLGFFFIVTASEFSEYFSSDPVEYLLYLHAITFFVVPFLVIPNALLTRNWDFQKLFWVSAAGTLVELILVISLVLLEFSYYSLAIGLIANSVIQLIALHLLNAEIYYVPRFKQISDIMKSGTTITLASVVNRFTMISSDLIIGKIGNARDVAFFSKGIGALDNLSQTILMSAHPIALPFLSQIHHENNDIKAAYLKASELVNGVILPFFVVMALANYPLTILLFGEQWTAVPPLVSYLALWMFFKSLHALSIELFFTLSQEKLFVIKESAVLFLMSIAILVGYHEGLVYVAKLYIVIGIVDFLLTSYFIHKLINLRLSEFFSSQLAVLVVSMACFAGTYFLSFLIDFESSWVFLNTLIIFLFNLVIWVVVGKAMKLAILEEIFLIFKKTYR